MGSTSIIWEFVPIGRPRVDRDLVGRLWQSGARISLHASRNLFDTWSRMRFGVFRARPSSNSLVLV